MPLKLVIDADPGIGDALAIVLALLDPEVDVVGLTAVAGRTSGEQATRNIQAIVTLLDPPKWPRLGAATGQAIATDSPPTAESDALNGHAGLGEFSSPDVELHSPTDSARLLTDLARAHPNELTLLTLGPLTNIELAAERDPQFLTLLRSFLCLGGTLSASGDVTAVAEYNIFAAPEAARMVLTSPATKTLIPLETAASVTLTLDQYDRLQIDPMTRLGSLLNQMLPFAFKAHHECLGVESIALKEVVALAAVTHARLFDRESACIDVETAGELTSGMTVFDRRAIERWQTNIDVLPEVDGQGVLDYLTATLREFA